MRKRNRLFPAWARISEFQDHPAGPAWRGYCEVCDTVFPIRQVPLASVTPDVVAAIAADPPSGPLYEAMRAAENDLRRHLVAKHGIKVGLRDAADLRIMFGEPL